MARKREEKPRDRNRYAGGCADCPAWVEAQKGFLYRHSGANLGRMGRSRTGRYTYVVRCEACALEHDGPGGRAEATTQVEHSGVTYTGFGGNSHAPCGN